MNATTPSEKSPLLVFLRWLLFLPSGIAASILVFTVVYFTTHVFWKINLFGSGFFPVVLRFCVQGLAGFSLIWTAARVAPKFHFQVALVLSAMSGALILVATINGMMNLSWHEYFWRFGTLVGFIAACQSIHSWECEQKKDASRRAHFAALASQRELEREKAAVAKN